MVAAFAVIRVRRRKWRAAPFSISSRRNIEAALDRARAAAKDKDVRIGGGAATVRQYLQGRLIDGDAPRDLANPAGPGRVPL